MNPEHKCILLVEDNPADVRLMVELLADTGAGEVELQHYADIAMYRAKRDRNKVCFYGEREVDL
jgi:CheY-like chemotaxis protein